MAVAAASAASARIWQVQQFLAAHREAAAFAAVLYGSKDLEDLEERSVAWLADTARAALEFIEVKPAGRHKLRIRRALPAGPSSIEASVIEILNDDMPFLVDSVLGELQARGLTVRLLLHPILKTRRDRNGHLVAVTTAGDGGMGDGLQ
jgi:glutamate dehydrogenase